MWTWDFWKKTIERASKTLAEVYLAAFGVDGANMFSVNYTNVTKLAVSAAVVAVLVSLVSGKIGPNKNDPSVV